MMNDSSRGSAASYSITGVMARRLTPKALRRRLRDRRRFSGVSPLGLAAVAVLTVSACGVIGDSLADGDDGPAQVFEIDGAVQDG